MKTRDEVTRDPIFLFQKKIWNLISTPDDDSYHIDTESNIWKKDDEGNITDELATWEELEDMECAICHWYTDLVFLTREEGEAYGTARAYNYPDGWRVYCVCAEGSLKEVLNQFDMDTPVG